MQYKCRRLPSLFMIVSWGVVVTLPGCGATPTTVSEKPLRGIQVRLAVPSGLEESLRPAIRGWQARQGTQVKPVAWNSQEGPEQPADIWIVPTWQVPRWIAAGKLQPLPESLTRQDRSWTGLLPIYRENLIVWQAAKDPAPVPYAVPLLGEAPVLCYRADWYADPIHQQAYRTAADSELRPPQTWPELVRQAGYFKQAGYPFPALREDPIELERLFGQVAAGYDRRPVEDSRRDADELQENVLALFQDLKTGQPRLERAGFVHALGLLQSLQAARAAGGKGEPEEAFRDGQAALCLCEASWVIRFQEPGSKVRDRFNILPLPGAEKYFSADAGPLGWAELRRPNRMPYLGAGSYAAVLSAEPAVPEAAHSLLAHLLDPEVSTALIQTPAGAVRVVRVEQLEDGVKWNLLGLDVERTAAARQALRTILAPPSLQNPALALRMPEAEAYRSALVQALRRVLLEQADARASLTQAAQAWQELGKANGPELTRANARRSVGLTP